MSKAKPHARGRGRPTVEEVFEDIECRFLLNVPEEELKSPERLFFQIEQCHWFYEDFFADKHDHLHHMKLPQFTKALFQRCPMLAPVKDQYSQFLQKFKQYKSTVPVNGCIILNPSLTKILLVKGWFSNSWTFPRGKINEGESHLDCAIRETNEEVGYDASAKILRDTYLEGLVEQTPIRMYLVPFVEESVKFVTQTRKEISEIRWFKLESVPKHSWAVTPFVPAIRQWISSLDGGSNKVAKKNVTKGSSRRSENLSTPNTRKEKMQDYKTKMKISGGVQLGRSQSNPHTRPKRGHFGTEHNVDRDLFNNETFGCADDKSWSVDDMFATNERITGLKFEYDGNPHDFGNPGTARIVVHRNTTKEMMPNRSAIAENFGPSRVGHDGRDGNEELCPAVSSLFRSYEASQMRRHSIGKDSSGTNTEKTRTDRCNESTKANENVGESKSNVFGNFKFDAVEIMDCVS